MGTVTFVSWWGGGNMTPVLSLGAEMRRRGHTVTVLGPAQFAARLALDGIDHRPIAAWSPSVQEVRDTCDAVRPDLLVIDGMMGEVLAAAPSFEGAATTAALVHTMWQPVADGQWDNVSVFCGMTRINEIRRSVGLGEVTSGVELLRDVDHVLAAMPEPLDRPLQSADEWTNAQYLGPLLEEPGPDLAWTPPPGYGPLVVVGLGTTPMDEDGVLHRVLEAIGRIGGARFLVTVGDHLDPGAFEEPANVTLTRYVRHAAVLPHASLVVSHAGLGTMIAAAAHGLPMLCLPLGRDQPANAERVKELAIGAAIDPSTPPEGIRLAVERLLEAEAERKAAIALAGEIVRRHPSPHDVFEAVLTEA